jgi:hypothetical protein
MKWFRRAEASATNTPPTVDALLPNTTPTRTLELLQSLTQLSAQRPPPTEPPWDEMRAFHAKKMQSLDKSIAGLTSVAECERDQHGRFAPRRLAARPPAAELWPAVDEPPPAWWMAL